MLIISASASAEVAEIKGPAGVALDGDGNILVCCHGSNSVVIMSRDGELIEEFGSDRLVKPASIAVMKSGNIVILNTGKNEVLVYDNEGGIISAVGGFNNPQQLAIAKSGIVYVANAGTSQIAVLAKDAKTLLFMIDTVAGKKLNAPAGVATRDGKLVISDTGNGRILVMKAPTKKLEKYKATTVIAPFGLRPGAAAMGKNGQVYVLNANKIFGFTKDGKKIGEYGGLMANWFSPGGIFTDEAGNIMVSDRTSHRILVTNADLHEALPKLTLKRDGNKTDAVIEWTSLKPQPTVLAYGTVEDCESEYKNKKLTTKHRVVLENLAPNTRFYYHLYAPIECIPMNSRERTDLPLKIQQQSWNLQAKGFSVEHVFVTLPKQGMTEWNYVPTAIVIYKNVTFPDGKGGKKQPNRVMDDKAVELVKGEFETYRLWAWRHSSLKMNFDFAYIVVDEERDANLLGGPSTRVVDDIVEGLKAQGKDLNDYWYANICGVHGWYALYLAGVVPASDGTLYELGTCYTGVSQNTKPGWWWFPTHEHGHLVHSMVMCSGTMTFAFPDSPWVLDGQFGENFSFLAYNYRAQPVRSWLNIKKGVLCESVDANGDGVPDNDPRVPLDQKRFGWTKDMGGDCKTRIMAGGRTPGYPGGTDTDFEGKKHKLNKGELHWIDRKITKATPTIDGKLGDKEWVELYSVPNVTTPKEQRVVKAKLYVAWDDKNYYFAIKSDKQVAAGFDLDGNNDGWFHGRDNLRFSARPPMGGRKLEVGGQIWDFLNNTIQPTGLWYKDAYKPGDIKAAVGEQDGWHIIEIAVPARPDVKIATGKGAKFGLRVYLSNDTKENPIPGIGFFDGEDFVYDFTCKD